jgi:hypothetical protein
MAVMSSLGVAFYSLADFEYAVNYHSHAITIAEELHNIARGLCYTPAYIFMTGVCEYF